MLDCDSYLMPATLDEALAAWAEAPEGSRIVAGATDILPWAREGRAGDVRLPLIVDISRVAGLDGYQIADGRIRLGANVVYQRFLTDAELRRHLPAMPHCAVWFADDQIRELATLAGNIVNASPAADGTPVMLAANASVELMRREGDGIRQRSVPLRDFVTGPARTCLEPGEIVTAVECESMEGYGGAFEKVGQRRSLVISTVCIAAFVKPSVDGRTFDDVRLAAAGIGPIPVRLEAVEQRLRGAGTTQATIAAAARLTDGLVKSRTRRDYREHVTRGFIARAIEDALAETGSPSGGSLQTGELQHA